MLLIALILVSLVAISAVSATSDIDGVDDNQVISDVNNAGDEVVADGETPTNPNNDDSNNDNPSDDGTNTENDNPNNDNPSDDGTNTENDNQNGEGTGTGGQGTTPGSGGGIGGLGNGTGLGFGNGTGRGNSSIGDFDISSIISMFMGGGSSTQETIKSADLKTYYAKTTTFKVKIKTGDNALSKGSVIFTVNNKNYVGHIGSNGYAYLTLKKLKPGKHYVFIEYGQTVAKNVITVKKSIKTKNVVKKYNKAKKFKVKILNRKGKAYKKQTVKIRFRGQTYTLKTNKKGIAAFKIPKKLKVGKYTIKTTYAGLTVKNTITVK